MQIRTQLDSDGRALLSRAQSGDTSAFEKLVERHRDDVYAFGLRMTRSETGALEIAQESFLSACLHLAHFRNEKEFKAWLHLTAASHALLRLGRRGTAPVADETLAASEFNDRSSGQSSAEGWGHDVDEMVLNAELRRAIEEATDGLRQGHREALLLKDVAGLSYQQIADVSRTSIPEIKRRLHEARLRLRATIEQFYRKS